MTNFKYFFWVIVLGLIFSSCMNDEDAIPSVDNGVPDIGNDTDNIPQWIYEEMDFFYYWNDDLPEDEPSGNEDPETYFYGLLNSTDEFSYISDDAESLKEEITGTIIAMGFSPTFGLFTNTGEYFAIVEYVYPGSPAESAGLVRGDIILELNGEKLSAENYLDLISLNGISVTLGRSTSRGIVETNEVISIETGIIELDPVIHYEVKDINNIKTGYLVFVDFISGEDDIWLTSLAEALAELKSQGISQLILDLRYNPGGEVGVARYLASAIAPREVMENGEILVQYEYNEKLQDYFIGRQGEDSPNIVSRFGYNENNLNLNNVIILTTGSTASASELLINGLDPYMNVTVIGEPTFGKYYGSYLLYDQNDPPNHNWAIAPVVLKYANAAGFTDFINGLTPDISVDDDLLNAKPFGDESDPVLAVAISYIKGEISTAGRVASARLYTPIYNIDRINKKNIFTVNP